MSCLASAPTSLDAAKTSSDLPKSKTHRPIGGPVCPYCRTELSWDTMQTSETEVTIYVREKMYSCPSCRALLGFSSWHTEG